MLAKKIYSDFGIFNGKLFFKECQACSLKSFCIISMFDIFSCF